LPNDSDGDGSALRQRHALSPKARASVFAERQESCRLAEPQIQKRTAAAVVHFAHAREINFAPTRAAALVAGAGDAQRDRFAGAHQSFAGFADAGIAPDFERLAHAAPSSRHAVS
jgi:hypothetical protein